MRHIAQWRTILLFAVICLCALASAEAKTKKMYEVALDPRAIPSDIGKGPFAGYLLRDQDAKTKEWNRGDERTIWVRADENGLFHAGFIADKAPKPDSLLVFVFLDAKAKKPDVVKVASAENGIFLDDAPDDPGPAYFGDQYAYLMSICAQAETCVKPPKSGTGSTVLRTAMPLVARGAVSFLTQGPFGLISVGAVPLTTALMGRAQNSRTNKRLTLQDQRITALELQVQELKTVVRQNVQRPPDTIQARIATIRNTFRPDPARSEAAGQ